MTEIAPGITEFGPAGTAAPVVVQVTMRQARLALQDAGKLAQVATLIAGLTEPLKTRALIEWEYAAVVRRDGPLLVLLQPMLGWTDAEIDALFAAAAAIP